MSDTLTDFVLGEHTLNWHDHKAIKKEANVQGIRKAMEKKAQPLARAGAYLAGIGRTALQQGLPLAATGAVAALGSELLLRGPESIIGAMQRSGAFKRMLVKSPDLAELPTERVRAQFNTLYGFSPSAAKSPLVAGSWLRQINAHSMEGKEYMPPETLRDLVAVEKSVSDIRTRGIGRTIAQEAIKSLLARAKPPAIALKPGTTLTVSEVS